MLRQIVIPDHQQYLLTIPAEYLHRRIEILVLPYDTQQSAPSKDISSELQLTTFRCNGKIRDFTREDAYREWE